MNSLIKYFIFLLALLIIINGCTDETMVVNNDPNKQTLLIISDFNEASDVIVSIIGAVNSKYPNINVRHIQVKAFDFKNAAYIFDIAAQNFPAGTYIVGIVEPGASTPKIIFNAEGKTYLVPDNGLASRIYARTNISDVYFAENPDLIGGDSLQNIPFDKFYKYTILSMLSSEPHENFGRAVDSAVKFDVYKPEIAGDTIKGEVLYTDNFGNCVTNIPDSLFSNVTIGDIINISTPDTSFYAKFGVFYSSVDVGQNTAFINSSKRCEIAVNYGDMSQRYGMSAGTQVSIITKSLTVGIIKYTNSSVVTDIVRGMKAELSIKGLIDGENIKYLEYSASGNPDLLPGFVDMLIAAKVDIIVPVSTPASQAAVLRAPENIPVIFTYVTDPESAGIIGVRKHVSGLSDATNFKDFLAFVRQLLPQFTSHGHIYNPNESNSTFAYNQLHLLSGLYGFTIKSYPVNSGGDIMSAYTSLKMDNMKSILIVADNTMSAGISVLSGLADNDNIAVIGDSYEHARDGALAAISVDYDALSKSTGDMVLSVLLGMDPDNMPVQKFSTDVISINTATAGKIGFTFPQEIKDKAKYVFP